MIDMWHARVTDADVTLELDVSPGLPELVADPGLMEQVMNNLLENALKFSSPAGTIRVRAWHAGGEICIAVADSGIGIPPDKLEQIFERFYQVNGSQTRSVGGMGIGLALCRSIVNAHGGRMWAESPGDAGGATFFVALPCDTDAATDSLSINLAQ
jgi:signal transduction histidine kinase